MTKESRDRDIRSRRSERRARQSLLLALRQIRQAADDQLQVLSQCSDQIQSSRDEQTVRSCHLRMSNEMGKLQAIVSRLDSLTSGMSAEEFEALAPEIQKLQQHISNRTSAICMTDRAEECLFPGSETACVRDEDSAPNDLTLRDNGSHVLDLESEVADQQLILRSCTRLENEVRDLNDVVHKFSRFVWSQKETTDRIDSNVLDARHRLETGAVILSKISKGSALPLIGAAIGTAIAGPIGMIMGYKVAAVACLGSATAGYLGGKVVQRKTELPAITQTQDSTRVLVHEDEARDR